MKTITNEHHEFVVVDAVPCGTRIWNIGEHMIDGYLPLVRVGGHDGCQVVGIKHAIKVNGAQTILKAIGYGPSSVMEMESYITKHSDNKSKAWDIEKMRKAIPLMRQVKGL